MQYWLLCLPRPDLKTCIDAGVFGLYRSAIINRVKQGDKVLFCAGKGDWKIIATGHAESDYYVDDKPVFLSRSHVFPDRFKLSAKMLPNEIELQPLLSQLKFVSNMAYWAVFFRNGIVKLPEEDWDFLEKKIAAAQSC